MTQQIEQTQTVATGLEEIVLNRQRLAKEIKELQALVDNHTQSIKEQMLEEGVTDLEVAGFKISLNPYATRESLDKTLLVEQGVTTDQIKAATKETVYQRLDIREVKGK